MSSAAAVRLGIVAASLRVFALSLAEMLRSRRTIFLALLVASPVLLALAVRLSGDGVSTSLRVNGQGVAGAAAFGLMIWILFVRFIVPVLGVFYGTGLIADEVEDKTITYLFCRPIPRGAVLLGKYLAYVVCTTLVVLPAAMVLFFVLVPPAAVGALFPLLLKDLGILAIGLAVYGALFGLVGAVVKRPLVVGLVFALGWEPVALLFPGYLKRLTVAYYVQALVPHAMPPDAPAGLLQVAFRDVPSPAFALFCLVFALIALLALAVGAVSRREYVLDQ